ncbi:CP4-57 prophage protein [Escherichia coli]|nr:CP4-57 prophage protein [Escherichia coli]
MRLASRFGYANQIRRDRPLTREELMQVVPSVFGEEKHTSRSENYTWNPTITVLESLQREGFQPFFACQTRVRDCCQMASESITVWPVITRSRWGLLGDLLP